MWFTRGLMLITSLAISSGIVTEAKADAMVEAIRPHQGKQFEVEFLGNMIHHHASAVRMADLALERAGSGVVREMASKMIEDQTKEIGQMSGWLHQWHRRSPDDVREPAQSRSKAKKDLAHLRGARGAEFDRRFLSLMSEHHRSGIKMARLVSDRTERDPLQELASKMIEAQSNETAKMQRLLASRD